MAWLDLAAVLLAIMTVFLLSLDYCWRRLTFSMRRLLPWVAGGWVIILTVVMASWFDWH